MLKDVWPLAMLPASRKTARAPEAASLRKRPKPPASCSACTA
ncbi:hypothetical protein ACE3MS_05620 [Paenibacillus dendritiformis]|nr:hypothetical protein [Paenibacillus dendritiformis]